MNSVIKSNKPERPPGSEGNFYQKSDNRIGSGMNERIQRLRQQSVDAEHTFTIERALLETAYYKENFGKYSIPVLRALVYMDLCQKKTLYLGDVEKRL